MQNYSYRVRPYVTFPVIDMSPSVIMMGAIEANRRSTARECSEGLAGEYFKAMQAGNVDQAEFCLKLKMATDILGE